jgi:hypothetical protein
MMYFAFTLDGPPELIAVRRSNLTVKALSADPARDTGRKSGSVEVTTA